MDIPIRFKIYLFWKNLFYKKEDMPYINAIIGESLIAVNQGGLWVGSLESFDPNKGYYFVMNNQLDFSLWKKCLKDMGVDPSKLVSYSGNA